MIEETALYLQFKEWYNTNYNIDIEEFEQLDFDFKSGVYERFFNSLGGGFISEYDVKYNQFKGYSFYWSKSQNKVFFEGFSKKKLIKYLFENWK